MAYRSWADRRKIVAAIIAEINAPPVESFKLTPSEEVFFRARANRVLHDVGRRTSIFKAYYDLRTKKPFRNILGVTALVCSFGVIAALYLLITRRGNTDIYPLFAACAAVTVASIGWCVAAWIAHRNAIRQNTVNLLFARFSQATFAESMHRFHAEFGYDVKDVVSTARIAIARKRNDEGAKASETPNYLLNYFEFIAAGVLNGDLDAKIVRDNIKGYLSYYYDKCEPFIFEANARNSKAFEFLRKLRTHYREP